jgi:hypothetical protein
MKFGSFSFPSFLLLSRFAAALHELELAEKTLGAVELIKAPLSLVHVPDKH